MSNDPKLRYSDEDLQEFKILVDARLKQAQEELTTTEQQIADLNENGFNQQGGDWYDDSPRCRTCLSCRLTPGARTNR